MARIRSFATLVCILAVGGNAKAQGLINFVNSPATLVTLRSGDGPNEPMPGVPGKYQFQLFIAPAGTLNPDLFVATNVKGTNLASAGRFSGGFGVAVDGTLPGEMAAILVRGWSSNYGADYATALDNLQRGVNGFLGTSSIAPIFYFGGFDGTEAIPTSPAFGGSLGIQTGLILYGCLCPEPSVIALVGSGAIALVLARRRKRRD